MPQFLRHLVAAVPYEIHTMLTDNGIQFTNQPGTAARLPAMAAHLRRVCDEHGIEHG